MPLVPLDLFLEYVKIDTQSRQALPGEEKKHPSTPGQTVLAKLVFNQLLEIGLPENQMTWLDDGSFLVAMPATEGLENAVCAAFAVHLDTYFGCPGAASPIIHNYSGGDIVLPNGGVIIPAADLAGLAGKRIVTADGTSLLGADDKAGVATIVAVISRLIEEEIPHGPLYFWFCVDEEIGKVGVKHLSAGTATSWDILWTVDGKEAATIDIGCFNGAEVIITFKGNDAHPGVAGDQLKPAHYAAAHFVTQLGDLPTPWNTLGNEPFYYAFLQGEATPGATTVQCFPRTFKLSELDAMGANILSLAKQSADKYGVTIEGGELKILYVSTEEAIAAHPELLAPAVAALEDLGYSVIQERVRAGTDGAMLNMVYPDIPSPNLGTGAGNLHGVQEFLVVDEFEGVMPTVLRIIDAYSKLSG